MNVGLALVVDRAAQRHDDPRLLLVGLGFLAAALFFVLHALATPGVLLDTATAGSRWPRRSGSRWGRCSPRRRRWSSRPERAERVLRAGRGCARGSTTLAAVWGIFSLAGLPPLARPGDRGRG